MPDRYRYVFSSRQDFRKTMALLATAAMGLAIPAVTAATVHLAGHTAGWFAAAAGFTGCVLIVTKTSLTDYEG